MRIFLIRRLALLFFVLVTGSFLFAQNKEKPKVALVLSGGGAKGIAHIPLLQKLDSLNIVPDLIIGTSMGSIVGGFYAMGYSGDSIASIVEQIDWNVVFGKQISLKDVTIEEKSEFGSYLTEFDLIDGKPKVQSELINDQGVRELFAVYTYPVFNINNFDELSIPFRAIAVDIVKGDLIIMGDGKLRTAMRASMSIPGVFKPVERDSSLLIDGGVLNNFPTDIAKEMGADIIIGSDVGGGMAPKEKLNNLSELLFQTGMLNSNLLNPENRALCDILLTHKTKEYYSSADFNKSKEIYKSGKAAVSENLDKLIALSDQMKTFDQRKIELPHVPKKLKVDQFKYKDISPAYMDLVQGRFGLKNDEYYDVSQVINGVQRIMGTTLFKGVNFNEHKEQDSLEVEIEGVEHSKHRVKASLHYDEYRGVGIILNYTARSVFGDASKLLLTVDIAEQPKLRFMHQTHFGIRMSNWWRTEFFAEHLRQDLYKAGESVEKIKYRHYTANTHFNFNTNDLNSSIGLGIEFKHSRLFPSVNPELDNNFLNLKNYYFDHLDGFVHYNFNSMDKQQFATAGSSVYIRASQSLVSNVDAESSDESISPIKGATNGFSRLNLESEHRVSMSDKTSFVVGVNAGFTFENQKKSNSISYQDFGIAAHYTLGGYLQNARFNSHRFYGLNEDELIATQFMNLDLGFQWNLFKNFYFTPHTDVASVGFGSFSDYIKGAFNPSGDWQENLDESFLFSAGTLFEYNSLLGPVKLDFSWVNRIEKFRVFFAVGLFF